MTPVVKNLNPKKILISFLGTRLRADDIEDHFSKFGAARFDYALDSRDKV